MGKPSSFQVYGNVTKTTHTHTHAQTHTHTKGRQASAHFHSRRIRPSHIRCADSQPGLLLRHEKLPSRHALLTLPPGKPGSLLLPVRENTARGSRAPAPSWHSLFTRFPQRPCAVGTESCGPAESNKTDPKMDTATATSPSSLMTQRARSGPVPSSLRRLCSLSSLPRGRNGTRPRTTCRTV